MWIHKLVFIVLLSALSACSSLTPWRNPPLPPGTPDTGVDTARLTEKTDPSFIIVLSISGGGARAAAFGYGVLKELADTQIRWNGHTQTLLSQVDVVRGVSGGSIVAAYYALNGSKTFPAFKNDYLYKDFQQSLVSAIFSPQNFAAAISPTVGRGHVLAQKLDMLYEGKTYEDLYRNPHADLIVLATDLSQGTSFEFSPDQLATMCADIRKVPLSFAVASSAAVPMVLSPLTLKNYAGQCEYSAQKHEQVSRLQGDYRMRAYRSDVLGYLDSKNRPYIHLVDGGLSDNLGVRGLMDRVTLGIGQLRRGQISKGTVRKVAFVVVNAERDPSVNIDKSENVPTLSDVFDTIMFSTSGRVTTQTMQMVQDTGRHWATLRKSLNPQLQGLLAPDAQLHVVPVSLREAPAGLAVPRRHLLRIPTLFTVNRKDVDALIEAGRQTLRQNPEYQALLQGLGAQIPQPAAATGSPMTPADPLPFASSAHAPPGRSALTPRPVTRREVDVLYSGG